MGYYSENDVDVLFEDKSMCSSGTSPKFIMACFDPKLDNVTASCLFCYVNEYMEIIITHIDTCTTRDWNDFQEFFKKSMKLVHKNFRSEIDPIPIIVAVEALNWSKDALKDYSKALLTIEHDSDFKNVVFLDTNSVVGKNRNDEMEFRMSTALKSKMIKIHSNCGTIHPEGINWILNELKTQLKTFRQLEGEGHRLADTFHFTAWSHWFLYWPAFKEQRLFLETDKQ